ncbi:MAG: hypothetical protein LW832_07770 [Parachlamydia sp.]|jgi:hypothetical protein|nr:hypothetical protein [Parachlamydia sp.]
MTISNTTNALCIIPFIQQGIGAATFISNTFKVINDLATAYFKGTWKGEATLYEERERVLNTPQEIEVNRRIRALPGYQFEEHSLHMLIGIIRFTPIIGSLWSYGVLKKYIVCCIGLNDPRNPEQPIEEYLY